MTETKIRVLVTAIGEAAVGGQILKALRLAETSYYIVGVDMSPLNLDYSKVDVCYMVPGASNPAYIDKLREICLKEKISILIPGSEPELLEISRKRDKFSEIGVIPIVGPEEMIELCSDKWQTFEFLKSNGFNYPNTILVENKLDLKKVDFYPVIIKPAKSSSGSKNVFVAQNNSEASFFVDFLLKQSCIPLIQEYVGSYDEEYTIGVLALQAGQVFGSIALRKLLTGLNKKLSVRSYTEPRELVISTGISQGEVEDFFQVRKDAEAIAAKLGVEGPINIQGRNTDQGFCTFEINPRFSGTTCIRALLGYNEPDIFIRYLLLGEKPSKVDFKKGYVMRGLAENYVSFEKVEKLRNEGFLKTTSA